MGGDDVSSPHRRSQGVFASILTPKKLTQNDISCSALVQRHRFLLTAIVLLVLLCTIYLYFAVTLGSNELCSGLLGIERDSCLVNLGKKTFIKGKLKLI